MNALSRWVKTRLRSRQKLTYRSRPRRWCRERLGSGGTLSTEKQKTAARRNLKQARSAKSAQSKAAGGKSSAGLSTAQKNDLRSTQFAFPKERKEPLTDAAHVRNAIARFDQVEGVTDTEREQAWKRIRSAARKFGVEVQEGDWRQLFERGKATKH